MPLSYAGSNDGSTCFFTERTPEGIGNRAGCIKLTDAQMSLATSFTGFDFESIWYMGSAHPQLRMKQPIQPVVPTGIVIVSLPDKTEYLEKEAFCPDGLSVVLCYSDGTSVPVTDYLLGGYEGTVGKHTVTVTHSGFCVTFPVTVKAVSPDAITSSVYTVTPQWLRKIPLHTTVSALIKGLDSSDFIAVFNGESQPGENAYVRTGMTVAIMDGNNRKFSVTAVVTGDVNGDGKLTSADLQEVIHHLLKKQLLSEAYAQATDCNGDGNVTLTDFLLLKSHILVDSAPTPN